MDSKLREKLIDAAVASCLEDLRNRALEAETFEEFAKAAHRYGFRGYAQMDDAELLEVVKRESGWSSVSVEQRDLVVDTTKAWIRLIRVIDEIEGVPPAFRAGGLP